MPALDRLNHLLDIYYGKGWVSVSDLGMVSTSRGIISRDILEETLNLLPRVSKEALDAYDRGFDMGYEEAESWDD